jgi:hypothetical protein
VENEESGMSDEQKIDPELAAALEPPAVAINRFYLAPAPHGARLSFGEIGPDGHTRYHLAIELNGENLLALAELIQKSVQRVPEGTPTPTAAAGGIH